MKFDPKHSAAGMYGPAAPAPDDLPELRAWLIANCEAVTEALLGPPNQVLSTKGRQLRWGDSGGLSLELRGAKRGLWNEFGRGGGDMFALIARELPCDFSGAITHVRERMGNSTPPKRGSRAQVTPAANTDTAEAERSARKLARAKALFDEGQPIDGTQGAAYFAVRCVKVPPGAPLRFHDGVADSDGKRHPGIIAAVTTADGTFLTAHRTYLDREGKPGKAGPAQARFPRQLVGSPGAGGVWLAPAASTAIIGEGIETTLSGLMAMPGVGAVAAISTSGLKNLALPEVVQRAFIMVDVDDFDKKTGGRPGEAAAREAAARWSAQGIEVHVVFPGPKDGPKIDMNDLLLVGGVDGVRAAFGAAEVMPSTRRDHGEALIDAAYDLATEAEANLPRGVSYPDDPFEEIEPLPEAAPFDAAQAQLAAVVADAIEQGARVGVWGTLKEQARREAHAALAQAQHGLSRFHSLRADKGAIFQFLKAKRRRAYDGYRAGLTAGGWVPGAAMPAATVIKATVGLGKSHMAMAEIARLVHGGVPMPAPFVAVWLVSSHEDAAQAREKFKALHVPVAVLAGRDRERPDGLGKMCTLIDHNPKLTEEMSRNGASFTGSLCRKGAEPCPFAKTCGWMTQAEAIPQRGVVIATHDVLRDLKYTLPGGLRIEKIAALTVCDENPGRLADEARHDAMSVDVIEQWSRSTAKGFDQFPDVFRSIAAVMRLPDAGGATWREELKSRGVTPGALDGCADGLSRAVSAALAGVVGNGAAARSLLRQVGPHRRAIMRARELMEALAMDWRRAGGGPIQTVEIREGIADGADGAGVRHRTWLALPLLRPVTLRPLLVLDASASEAVSARMFGADRTFHEIRAQQHLHVTFVPEPSFSYGNIGIRSWHGDANDGEHRKAWEQAEAKKTAAVVARIGRFMVHVVRRRGAGKVGLIAPKKIADAMRAAGVRDGYHVMHFNNLRGSNAMEGCDALVILGRTLPARVSVERDARTVFALDDTPLAHLIPIDADGRECGRYDTTARPIHRTERRHLRFDACVDHQDPRVDAMLGAACDEELAQGIGRLRAVRATAGNPKEVFMLCDRPPGLPVHDVVSLDVLEGLLAVNSALHAEGSPAVLLTAPGLAEGAPGALLKADGHPRQERAAKAHADSIVGHTIARMRRFRPGGGVPQNPYKYISSSTFAAPTPLAGFVAKSPQNGQIRDQFAIGKLGIVWDKYLASTALGGPNLLHLAPDVVAGVAGKYDALGVAAAALVEAGFGFEALCSRVPSSVQVHDVGDALARLHGAHREVTEAMSSTMKQSERTRQHGLRGRIPGAFGPDGAASVALLAYFLDVLEPYVVDAGGQASWRNSIEAPDGRQAHAMRGLARMFVGGALWTGLPPTQRHRPAALLLEEEAARLWPAWGTPHAA
jgi:hypothetical protein